MLSKLKKSNNKGFTIIEVMIVLAIAGLILLIVFLAVPALQRSSRNTQRKTDIGRIGGAATTVVSNNNGDITQLTNVNLQSELGTALAYYTVTNVTTAAAPAAAHTNGTTVDTVVVYRGSTCSGANATAGGSRQIAIEYSDEAGTGVTHLCTSE